MGKSDTLLAALLLALCVTPAGSYAQVEEASETKSRTEPVVSVLESSDEATRKTSGWDLEPQDDPFGPDQDSILPNVGAANELARDQLPIVPQPTTDAVELEEPQVLLRGPLHEAFADAYQADPTPNPVVNADPPEAIQRFPGVQTRGQPCRVDTRLLGLGCRAKRLYLDQRCLERCSTE